MRRIIFIGLSLLLVAAVGRFVFSETICESWVSAFTNDSNSRLTNPRRTNEWAMKEIPFNDHSLSGFQIVNQDVIFAVKYLNSNFIVFRTIDSGRNWEARGRIENANLMKMYFLNSDVGFLSVSKLEPRSQKNPRASLILKTNDGGLTWKTVHSSDTGVVHNLKMLSDGFGLAVGRSDPEVAGSQNYVLRTSNGGDSWEDISTNLRNTTDSFASITEFLSDSFISEKYGTVVLSNKGSIYSTTDNGSSWERLAKMVDEPAQSSFWNGGQLSDGSLWLGGGANSTEGTWGVLAFTNLMFGWDKHRLKGYSFSDVRTLGQKEFIAIADEQNTRQSFIFYSTDSGEYWSQIASALEDSRFISIQAIDKTKFLVITKDFRVLQFVKH